MKPTEVHIKQITPVLVSEKEAKFECATLGSRPRAVLYWVFDGKRLNSPLSGDHQTSTTITIKVKQIHNGLSLFCYAENPKIGELRLTVFIFSIHPYCESLLRFSLLTDLSLSNL